MKNIKKEAKVFARILRYLADTTSSVNNGIENDDDLDKLPELLLELADGFDKSGGVYYMAEQAKQMAMAFSFIAIACAGLKKTSEKSGNIDLIATFDWFIEQSALISESIKENIRNKKGGLITFDDEVNRDSE